MTLRKKRSPPGAPWGGGACSYPPPPGGGGPCGNPPSPGWPGGGGGWLPAGGWGGWLPAGGWGGWLSSGPGVLVMAASLSAGPRAGRLPRTRRGRPLRRTKGAAAAVLGRGSGVLLDLRPLALDVLEERKSTRRTSSHVAISDAVFS